jgi:hypothetical protein
MSALEDRYRAALRLYPAAWRALNADVVVGTLLDQADAANRTRPLPSEVVNLTLNGLRTRLGWTITVSQVFRDQLAALALGSGFALMAIMLVGDEWAPFASERYWQPVFGPFISAAAIVNFLWIAAFGLALIGLRRWTTAVLVIAMVTSVAAILAMEATPLLYARPPASALAVMIVLGALSLIGSPSRRRLALTALSAALVFGAFCFFQYSGNSWPFDGHLGNGWDVAANGWWAIALLLLAVVLVVIRRPAWVASLTAFAIVGAIYSIGTAFTNRRDLTDVVVGLAATAAVVAALAFASAMMRGYRVVVVRVGRPADQ